MSAAHRYTDVRNTTASKERLMVMLFETALRHMRTAARHLENKDRRTASPLIEKACQIVLELQATLKPEVAPKLTENLIEIYTFTAARLCRANITGDVKDLRQAERAFAPIVDGFVQAVAQMSQAGGQTTGQPATVPPTANTKPTAVPAPAPATARAPVAAASPVAPTRAAIPTPPSTRISAYTAVRAFAPPSKRP